MDRHRYIEHPPHEDVAPWILSYWSFHAADAPLPGPPFTVWADGCTSVGVHAAPGAAPLIVCTGPRVSALTPRVWPGSRLWGVRLWPDAVTPVLGIPARDLRDYVGPAPPGIASLFAGLPATLLASDDGDAVFAAADLWLSELLRDAPPPDPAVRAAVRAVVAGRGAMAAPDVARAAGIGLRQLQRRFRAATGLTLRDWSRVRRLREALALKLGAQPGGWSRIAAETGFVDQAHLNREFVALTGLVPSAAARMLANTEHERVTP